MHGDKSQSQREKALRRFHKGEVAALVATDVAARGIDVDDITQVVNFDAPEDRDTYVHRVGRTGRAGRTGVGVTFVMHDQARDIGKIAHELRLHAAVRAGRPQRRRRTRPLEAAPEPRAAPLRARQPPLGAQHPLAVPRYAHQDPGTTRE